jgi:hypothetical protein
MAAPAFRLATAEEVAAYQSMTAAEEQLLYGRQVARYRCLGCGRFVREATVRVIPHWEYGYGPEQDTRGDCSSCGADVDVTWGVA